MHRATRLQLTDLNPLFSCLLCGGYLVDATTVIECLHSFCRACIVRYLESNRFCPVCDVQVHKTKPLLSIRSDKTLQDIVYKLVPGLYQNEMKRRRELYGDYPDEAIRCNSEERGIEANERYIYSPNENISLSLEYAIGPEYEEVIPEDKSKTDDEKCANGEEPNVSQRRYLQCPAALTIGHLKKFITMKYGLPPVYRVEMRYSKEVLGDEYTLMDVAYIYAWKRSGPMRFFYTFTSQPAKKQKIFHTVQDSATLTVATPEVIEVVEPSESRSLSRTVKPKRSTKRSKLKGKSKPHKKVNSRISDKIEPLLLIKPHPVDSSSKVSNSGPPDSATELCNIDSSANSSSQDMLAQPQCNAMNATTTNSETVCAIGISSCSSQNLTTTSVVDSLANSDQTCNANSLNTSTVSPIGCSSDISMEDISPTPSMVVSSQSTTVNCTPKSAASSLASSAPSTTTVSASNISTNSATLSTSSAPSLVPNHVSGSSNGIVNSTSMPMVIVASTPSTEIKVNTPITSATSNGLISLPKPTEKSFLTSSSNLVVSTVSSPGVNTNSTTCKVLASDSAAVAKNSAAPTTAKNSIVPTTAKNNLAPTTAKNSLAPTTTKNSLALTTTGSAISSSVRSTPSPSRKSNTSHLKPIQSSTYISNSTLKFTLTSSCSPNHAGTATLSPAVIPNVDSPSNIMLISTTRTTSSTSSNVVSSVPGLIVCPTQNITMCSPPNIALIPSPGHGIRLTSQPPVRGSRRGRPPTRHNRGILPRTNKNSTHLLANMPVPRHMVGSNPRLANGSSQRSIGAPYPPISTTPSFVVCSIPSMAVQPPDSHSKISISSPSVKPVSSAAAMTVSSSLPITLVATSSTATLPSVFKSSPKPVTKSGNASLPKSQATELPTTDPVPNRVSVSPPQRATDTKNKLEPSFTEPQMSNDKELPSSDNSKNECLPPVNESKSKELSSNTEKPESLGLKDSSESTTIPNSVSPGKKEGITLKISVKNSTYHADFSDNDDLGCQPDLVVDEQKMDSSDEGENETDFVLKEKIKAIAEKEYEADATDDADSGRASDVSNQARSSCDDDVGSPNSIVRAPDVEPPVPSPAPPAGGPSTPVPVSSALTTPSSARDSRPHSKLNGIAHIVDNLHRSRELKKDNIGALDLSFCYGRKPEQDKSPWQRPRTVANPPVLDMKHRLPTCLTAPKPHTACAPAPKNNSLSISPRGPVSSPSPSSHSTIPVSRHSAAATQSKNRHIMAVAPSHHRMVTGTPSPHQANMATSPHNIASMLHRQASSSPHSRLIPPAANHSPPSSVSALRSMLSPSTPSPPTYEMMHPPSSVYKKNESSHRNSHNRHKGSNLAVFNPDPNGIRQKIVIKNMNARPSHHSSHHHRRL